MYPRPRFGSVRLSMLLLAFGTVPSACADTAVLPSQRDDQGEVVIRSPSGTSSRKLVSAALVQLGGGLSRSI